MNPRPNNKRSMLTIVVLIIIVVVIAVVFLNSQNQTKAISYSELITGMENGDIIGVYFVSNYKVNVLYKEDFENGKIKKEDFESGKAKSAVAVILSRDRIDEVMAKVNDGDENVIVWSKDPDAKSIASYILPVLSIVLLIGMGIMIFMTMRGKGGAGAAFDFGKTNALIGAKVKVRFEDVAGAEEEKEELKEIVEFLKQPKKFRDVGARIPKGVLLVGLPGTGKTLFAKAVAGEANVPFYSISGSDFVEMFVGVGASRVRNLFKQAKRDQPCIVFIDEIDAVGRKRGAGLGGGNDEREQTLNQLLVQMDGFDENDGVVIMAATNRADVLDPALLRPGRFDRQVYIHMPDVSGREAIFKVHSRNKPLSPEVDFKNLARLTTGFSGADIENLLNEAAIFAARDDRKIIFMKDVLEGINKVIAGPQKKSRVITERDKKITAYHEAGHALVGRFMKHSDAIQEVSIIPRGGAAGYTISRPKTDDNHVTQNYLNDTIAMTLGGRAAESIVFEDISTGASQDLKQATGMARKMVVEWGMSPALPNTYFGGEDEIFIGRDYQTQASYSEEIAAIIDKEIRRIIDANYARAQDCLNKHRQVLDAMVELLFKHDTIYGDEVDMLIEGKSVEEVSVFIVEKQEKREKEAEEIKKKLENEAAARENQLKILATNKAHNINNDEQEIVYQTSKGEIKIKLLDQPPPPGFKPSPDDKTIYLVKKDKSENKEEAETKVLVEDSKKEEEVKVEETQSAEPKAEEKDEVPKEEKPKLEIKTEKPKSSTPKKPSTTKGEKVQPKAEKEASKKKEVDKKEEPKPDADDKKDK